LKELNKLQLEKSLVRQQVEAVLQQLSPEDRESQSRLLCALLEAQPFWGSARSIMAFAPMAGEADIWSAVLSALHQGKTIALPRYDRQNRQYGVFLVRDSENDIVTGYYGIREPAPHCPAAPNLLDLILVPGVAFDPTGCRLGRGKGFYDRLLSTWRGYTCGVCYHEQIVERIPVEPHDVQLNCILTPTRVFQSGPVLND
jgi:5-formyltetrahydrofolate cyclo-ligase